MNSIIEPSLSANLGNYFEVANGASINISCLLLGQISNNSHSITWQFGNRSAEFSQTTVFMESKISSLDELPNNAISLYNRIESRLHITKARFQINEGKYYCIARNERETLSDAITLDIKGKHSYQATSDAITLDIKGKHLYQVTSDAITLDIKGKDSYQVTIM